MTRKLFVILGLLILFSTQPVYAAPQTAVLSIIPNSTTVIQGDTATVSIKLDTGGQAVIGTKIDVYFSPALSYQSFDAQGSVFGTEVDPPTVDTNLISFSRVDMNTSRHEYLIRWKRRGCSKTYVQSKRDRYRTDISQNRDNRSKS
jgi:hypothetical protein